MGYLKSKAKTFMKRGRQEFGNWNDIKIKRRERCGAAQTAGGARAQLNATKSRRCKGVVTKLKPRPGAFVMPPRELDSKSLKIRGLQSGDFRDQLIAASLKQLPAA